VLRHFAFVLAAGAAALGPVRAQLQDDGPVKMTPELALAMPLLQKGRDITVKYPVFINRTAIVRPGMILRVIYQPPSGSDDSVNLTMAHLGNMAQSYSRDNTPTGGDQSKPQMSPEYAHAIEAARREIWEVPVNFQMALAELPTDTLHLIYSRDGTNQNLDDERIDFYEGLFLGSPSGGVSVLAVETGSKADEAGFKAGDRIMAVGGRPMGPDPESFPPLWSTGREAAKEANAASFDFTVQSPSGATRTVHLPMPASFKSQLMDDFK